MTLSPQTLTQANSLIAEIYSDLRNLGPVNSFIQPGMRTADFDLPGDPALKVRAIEEKDSVYYHIFRAQ